MNQPSRKPSIFSWLKNNTYRSPSAPKSKPSSKSVNEESVLLNLLFSTSHRAANLRLFFFLAALILFWGLIVVARETCPRCDEIIFTMRTSNLPMDQMVLLFFSLVGQAILLFISPKVFPHILALLIPLWLSWRVASIFLDDVFELKNVRLSGKFLTRTAFAVPYYDKIEIRDGKVSDSDKNTTAVRIGGPAFAKVHLENAAVFVHSDGRPEVVGPTTNLPRELYIIPSFTRLRQAVDLRHQAIPLERVSSRTRDGIPVEIKNIRLLFSIQRGSASPNLKNPYPFSSDAILSLVFHQTGSGSQASVLSYTIINLVSAELAKFISQFTLAELLSTIGLPEIKKQMEMDAKVQREIDRLRQRKYRLHNPKLKYHIPRRPKARQRPPQKFIHPLVIAWKKSAIPTSNFIPRTRLSSLFYAEFTEEFPRRAQQRGVYLEWIDVGTWNPPQDLVSSRNQEAFHISNENITRGHPRVLAGIRSQSRINEIIRLNRIHPIAYFQEYYHKNYSKQDIIIATIKDYRSLLQLVRDQYLQSGKKVPTSLANALNIINQYLNRPRGHYAD